MGLDSKRERERETVKWGRGQSGVQSGQDLFVTRQELFIKKPLGIRYLSIFSEAKTYSL